LFDLKNLFFQVQNVPENNSDVGLKTNELKPAEFNLSAGNIKMLKGRKRPD
jgi:hypothetical protein